MADITNAINALTRDLEEYKKTKLEQLGPLGQSGASSSDSSKKKSSGYDYSWPSAVDNPDYDKGEISERELEAAKRQTMLGEYNANSTANQLDDILKGYDLADEQNAKLRDLESRQAARKADQERFAAMRNLQQVARGLLSSFGTAGNSSTMGNFMTMLRERNNADSGDNWAQLLANYDTLNNAFNESANQNQVSRFNSFTDTRKALRDMNADMFANINNINPNLLGDKEVDWNPVIGELSDDLKSRHDEIKARDQIRSGYIMPDNATQQAQRTNYANRNRLTGNDYYSRLINGFNGRS